MLLNELKLNSDNTELLIIGSQFRPGTLQLLPVLLDDGSVILPYKCARNIGVTFDSVLNFNLSSISLIFASHATLTFVIFIALGNFYLLSIRRF